MTGALVVFSGGPIFDGSELHHDVDVVFRDGVFDAICPAGSAQTAANVIDLQGRILSPGFVDLQVNGGGGVMLNEDPSVETLRIISQAHAGLGVSGFLPTLISDEANKVTKTIAAVGLAIEEKVPGIIGLHLEGPHLSVERKGAHDARYIRHMTDADLDELIEARAKLPFLMVTVAPESVSYGQVARLSQAGVIVSLGHTNADFDTCKALVDAGASCVTHLFNAMSQLGNREPGTVGLALSDPRLSVGLIADGIHVHPASMSLAWKTKGVLGQIYLVSDAMAVAGTQHDKFALEGRQIKRKDGRLCLQDGTLAGADLDLLQAVRTLVEDVSADLGSALAAATSIPGRITGSGLGELVSQKTTLESCNLISSDLQALEAAAC